MLFSFPASAAADDEVEEPLTAADTAVFTCTRNNGDVFHSFKSEDGTHLRHHEPRIRHNQGEP